MSHRAIAAALCVALSLFAQGATGTPTPPLDNSATASSASADSAASGGCFISGDGYLRARIRGALDLDLDWKNAEMECAGGPRPSGHGVRVSIGGPVRGDGRRIRLVFGIANVTEGAAGTALRTNVTLLFEGEQRVFATQGDDKCTVDRLSQKRVENFAGPRTIYRVEARGFCLGPATSLSRGERLFLTSFDFAGRVEFGDDDRHALTQPN
jgi:hypothetical protein